MKNLELHHFKAFNNTTPISLENPDAKNILLYGENKIGFVSPARRYEAPTVVRPPQM